MRTGSVRGGWAGEGACGGESGGLRGEEEKEEEDEGGGEGVCVSLISGEEGSQSLVWWNHLLTELTIPPILVVIFIHNAAPEHSIYGKHHTERATEPHPYSG